MTVGGAVEYHQREFKQMVRTKPPSSYQRGLVTRRSKLAHLGILGQRGCRR